MTVFFATELETVDNDDIRSSIGGDRLPEEILLPIMAGAYARGVAETFQLLGIPALFFTSDGRVLHATPAAEQFVHGPLKIRTQHAIARDAADNRVLSELIALALTSDKGAKSAYLPKSGLTMHALPLPDLLHSGEQMLKAVLIISPDGDVIVPALIQRMAFTKI